MQDLYHQPYYALRQELRFFADAGCTSPLPSPRLPSQATEATVWVRRVPLKGSFEGL